ncbi:hypothetical protein [Moritella sp. F3]|uniref:hypothetical protein n=1 Tax=Moritella sp. F3 TaxID=2718882 RepID=UPI0018E1BCF7|nr:hypothetical protein [Moritella sp. F3]GIC76551.1 hypothetical protein FMO001_12780 [Moritella sp. F1]GIC81696.1 hypothetical protein FMO003_19770 [Moritella sp. F3]
MLKNTITGILILSCSGCVLLEKKDPIAPVIDPADAVTPVLLLAPEATPISAAECAGDMELPVEFSRKFTAVSDPALLAQSIGEPDEGKLCQGQVYVAKQNTQIMLFRAWNSSNSASEFGEWWALKSPRGQIAQYRSDYQICYQWSPLDKMTLCSLKAGAKVVIGTGQSATCSSYLDYPTSAKKQVYVANAEANLFDCNSYNAEFNWTPIIGN